MMRLERAFALTIVGCVFTIVLAGCPGRKPSGAPGARQNTITIGAISPFTGDGADYGKVARTAIDLAVDEINAAGGVRGRTLAVDYQDDKGSPTDAVSAFQKLVSVDKVAAVLGPFYSGNVLACAPIAERTKTVLLSGSATSDNLTKAGEFTFRVCPTNAEQARTIARYAFLNLHLKTSYVIFRNVDYGVTLRDSFIRQFTALGGTVLGVDGVTADAKDLRAQLTKVKARRPAFVFAAVHYTEGAALLRQARELDVSSVVFGTDGGYDPQLLKIAGNAAEGSYWATIGWAGDTADPSASQFKQAYRKRYNEDPGAYSALYYDATKVLAKALGAAKAETGTDVQKALLQTTFQGATGLTKFDPNGDVQKPFELFVVKGGKFVPAGSVK